MIRGGIEYGLGIYVTGVDKDSVADHAELLVSERVSVNSSVLITKVHFIFKIRLATKSLRSTDNHS